MVKQRRMINLNHLYILHLFPTTEDEKTNKVCQQRYDNLMIELANQNITDYTLIPGEYNPSNTKQAIHISHKKIIQHAKDNNLPHILIAEDDIKFSHPNSFNYFISQIPESYDIFSGLVYSATMEGNRVINGASGIMTLYSVSQKFYQFFLSMDVNNHVDRECGLTAYKHEYYVCEPMVCEQRGGISHQLKREMYYHEYLRDKVLYSG